MIAFEGEIAGLAAGSTFIEIFDVLVCDLSDEEKGVLLADQDIRWLSPARWATILANFEPTEELLDRIGPRLEQYRKSRVENEASHHKLVENQWLQSKPVAYGITVTTMLVSVIAAGRLLGHRPDTKARWREIDVQGDGVSMLFWNVIFIFLFGTVDLVLTLLAAQTGGLLEMNPLGHQLADTPAQLAFFKLTSLLLACAILLGLRRYRGAQLASWWLCLLGTILLFRWLTYNSLFLT